MRVKRFMVDVLNLLFSLPHYIPSLYDNCNCEIFYYMCKIFSRKICSYIRLATEKSINKMTLNYIQLYS